MNKILKLALLAFVCSSCSVTLTEAGKKVQLMKNDPPAGCQEIGPVSGRANGVEGPELVQKAKTAMRNNAANMGANYVRLETAAADSVTGTAYKCPENYAPTNSTSSNSL